MNIQDMVLEYLRESPDPVSGQEMAEKLRTTRNSIWKAEIGRAHV